MKITEVRISNFRSIANAEINDCGNLNVLIGRNNSGKSNLLLAIKSFFDFLRTATLVATADPDISNLTDWFDKNDNVPVILTLILSASAEEIGVIRESISSAAPQMRNALEQTQDAAGLECELTFYHTPTPMGFISRISFISLSHNPIRRHNIFSLTRPAATEIASRDREVKQLAALLKALERLESEDYPPSLRERRVPIQAVLPRSALADLSEENIQVLDRIIKSSESNEDLRNRIPVHRTDTQARHSELLEAQNEEPFETFSGEAHVVPSYVNVIVGMIGQLKVHHLSEQRQPIGREEANRILNLKTRRGQFAVLKEIQDRVSELLGVRIDAFASEEEPSRYYSPRAELDVDDFLVQVNGSGIKESLRLILDYEFERPTILLVEEPEVHLHPALEVAMMQYLRRISGDCQIFLTTHSTNFLDIADLRNVYLVKRDSSTQVQLLDVGEAEEAIPQELGIRLSSLFMYDRLVFVEGPSDEQVLRSFASTLSINLSRNGVGFITTGGARNFTHYANASTLSFLAKRRVKLQFILDRDEKDLTEIEQLEGRLGSLGEMNVLKRRELENYLLNGNALARYIADKNPTGEAPDPTAVEESMRQVAQNLLGLAIERRVLKTACRPIIPDRRAVIDRGDEDFTTALSDQLMASEAKIAALRDRIGSALAEASSEIESLSPSELLDVIPGDSILDELFRNFGIKFNKRKDTPKIAAIMKQDEIPGELIALLKKLSN